MAYPRDITRERLDFPFFLGTVRKSGKNVFRM